jgi:hypothetical protein
MIIPSVPCSLLCDWVVVNGVITVNSEEMSEEGAEGRGGAAVVSNDRVPNGRPLMLWKSSVRRNAGVWVYIRRYAAGLVSRVEQHPPGFTSAAGSVTYP